MSKKIKNKKNNKVSTGGRLTKAQREERRLERALRKAREKGDNGNLVNKIARRIINIEVEDG